MLTFLKKMFDMFKSFHTFTHMYESISVEKVCQHVSYFLLHKYHNHHPICFCTVSIWIRLLLALNQNCWELNQVGSVITFNGNLIQKLANKQSASMNNGETKQTTAEKIV